jgi:hypothetical protein
MSRNPGEELPPITREIDGAVCCRFLLDIEGAPMHRSLSPAAAERAMRAARIRYHGTGGNYWIHFGDWERANRVLNEAPRQRNRGV